MSRPRSTRTEIISAVIAGLIVIAFSILLLAHDPLIFWNDDYEISILPVFADMARAWNHGEVPLLSPFSWVCGNLAGEFQYGVFSVFINGLIVCVWKLPLTFSQQAAAVSMAHLVVLSAGAFLLARGRKLSVPLSIFVALVASLNGWIICWGASDWFGALGAFTWLPWAWWAAERALDPKRSRWRFLWPAPFVYLLIAGGFPYTVLMLALVLVWLALRAVFEVRTVDTASPARTRPGGLAQANENWAAARWRHARSWACCPGLAGIARLRPRFRAGIASPLRPLAMARPVECMAWPDPAVVDGELVEFFVAVSCHTARQNSPAVSSRPPRCSLDFL